MASETVRPASRGRLPPRAPVVASPMSAQLHDRVWSIAPSRQDPCCHAFLLTGGRAWFAPARGAPFDLGAPALLWLPCAAEGAFRLGAGSEGATCAAAEDFVWRALGDSLVSADIRPLLDQTVVATSERLAPHLGELVTVFAALIREARDGQPGATAMMGLHTGLLLLHLWRASALSSAADAHATGATTLQRFRQLVELHYRDNLTIAHLADLAGVTRSRLHKACLSATGRTPLALVHERLIEEARLRLEQTLQPVEQIGYGLGFRDAGYFNRFFKRLTGVSPGQHRRSSAVRASAEGTSYASWP